VTLPPCPGDCSTKGGRNGISTHVHRQKKEGVCHISREASGCFVDPAGEPARYDPKCDAKGAVVRGAMAGYSGDGAADVAAESALCSWRFSPLEG